MPGPKAPDGQFDDAFERCWLPVFRFALAWTNDWQSAEDLAQDAFLRLWSKRTDLDWSSSMLPWLLTTTRHLATDRFRRLRRAVRLGERADSSSLDSDARLRWLDVRAAMSGLTPVQRSALVLTAVVGLDAETVADALGTSSGGVRAAVSRARAALRNEDAES
jgi:RNA polymerase sigma-70 factor (ECF subfamily)